MGRSASSPIGGRATGGLSGSPQEQIPITSPTSPHHHQVAEQLVKPKLRGVFHELGFYAAVAVGVVLVVTADPGKARISGAIFAACVAGCFGVSAVYHRPMWRPRARA